MCLVLEPRAAEWKAQTNPLSCGGTPNSKKMYDIDSKVGHFFMTSTPELGIYWWHRLQSWAFLYDIDSRVGHFLMTSTPEWTFLSTFVLLLLFSGQMFLMDRFFDGAFLTFGLEVIAFAERDQVSNKISWIVSKKWISWIVFNQRNELLFELKKKLNCFASNNKQNRFLIKESSEFF